VHGGPWLCIIKLEKRKLRLLACLERIQFILLGRVGREILNDKG
jgi:hypothetical protein